MAGERGPAKRREGGRGNAERWRTPAIVAASLALHALLLGYLGLRTVGADMRFRGALQPDPPPILIQLEPRPLLQGETARVRPAPRPSVALPAPAEARSAPGAAVSPQLESPDEEDAPAPPSPRTAAPAAGAPAPPAGGVWTVRPRTLGDRIGQGLRTSPLGCASPDLLSAAERAICDDRFGRRAATARPIEGSGDPARDGRFAREGARRLREYEDRRRPLAGGSGNVGPQDGPGSNFGTGVAGAHLDRSLRPESTENIRTRRDGDRSAGTPLTPGSGFQRERPR
ncbi:MAG TPA: hypothetical protein VFF48_08380 [Brevundimonas sp.]|nr:hypothetical protein [Brevundimonas sp.]